MVLIFNGYFFVSTVGEMLTQVLILLGLLFL